MLFITKHCLFLILEALLKHTLVNFSGDDKKKEGPCAGTKGFRAPEVRLAHFPPTIHYPDNWFPSLL